MVGMACEWSDVMGWDGMDAGWRGVRKERKGGARGGKWGL